MKKYTVYTYIVYGEEGYGVIGGEGASDRKTPVAQSIYR
jgi:hypothetical protein